MLSAKKQHTIAAAGGGAAAAASFVLAGMTLFGGLTPLAMTAIQTGTKSVFIGPALWMVGMALISIVSSVFLIKFYPLTNQRGSI
jgi:hypothetical protein